ncbi:hypothetical protein OIU84_023092 [Salix udensis]|uniref:Uncharacterized protein n=1 Tax=Salix udensis TaxID=889485 RepID=A0AAD6PGJ5_9ROSI|nr:hypothetical protein OIU84_023092 [Salix udensis]
MIPVPLLISNDSRHHIALFVSGYSVAESFLFCIYMLLTGCHMFISLISARSSWFFCARIDWLSYFPFDIALPLSLEMVILCGVFSTIINAKL